ncbi:unnamed protein product [Blepharisma stoltei]|uniref:F-box domain-containing protein n=1 Tax=Blepharisma stoltei TaxID=1481888 RepID=A0AAU9IX82_9CILI|nr:unnamed protein product [Blepharisma stoltei]
MEKPPAYWIAKFQNKSSTSRCLIHLLGQNVTREIISYLTLEEFINFTMTCKKLWRFAQDPCVRINGSNPGSSALKYVLYQDETIGGQNFSEIMIKRNYSIHNSPKIGLQWTNTPQKIFHFVNIKGENYFIAFKDTFINVYEIPTFKNELIKRESWFCKHEIIDAAGFKNKIVVSYEGGLGLFVYGRCEDLEYFEDINCSKLAVEIAPRHRLTDLKWFENGHLIIAKSRRAIQLYRSDLELIHEISVEEKMLEYHVPSIKTNDFVVYYDNVIKAYKSALQTHVKISYKEIIKVVSSTQYKVFDRVEHALIVQSNSNHLYKNHEALPVFARSFKVDREFLLFIDETSHLTIYDMRNMCFLQDVIEMRNSLNWALLTYISFYKSIYLTKNDKYEINVYHYKEAAPLIFKTPFNKIVNQFYIHPFLCLSGTRYGHFGIMILNLYSYIHHEVYEDIFNYELPPKRNKNVKIPLKKQDEDNEEKKEERVEYRRGNLIRYKEKEKEEGTAKAKNDKKEKKDKHKKHH